MVDIQTVAAEIRRGKKRKKKTEDRKKSQGKNIMAPLLHRAAIKNRCAWTWLMTKSTLMQLTAIMQASLDVNPHHRHWHDD